MYPYPVRALVLIVPLLTVACQGTVDFLVPGKEQGDGKSRLLQLGQDAKSGPGTARAPALVHVQALAGSHVAVRVDGGTARVLDEPTTPAASRTCVLLPLQVKAELRRTQLLVESPLAALDVFVGLVTFDETEATAVGAGRVTDDARRRLVNVCGDGFLLDQDHLFIKAPGLPTPDDGDGGTGGSGAETPADPAGAGEGGGT